MQKDSENPGYETTKSNSQKKRHQGGEDSNSEEKINYNDITKQLKNTMKTIASEVMNQSALDMRGRPTLDLLTDIELRLNAQLK